MLAVFIGGCLGGVARWGISLWLNDAKTMLGTTAVNLVGSFLLAFVTYGLAVHIDLPSWLLLALGTGFLGTFTTFSTMVLNLCTHFNQAPVAAIGIVLLELVGGLGAAFAGYRCAEAMGRGQRPW